MYRKNGRYPILVAALTFISIISYPGTSFAQVAPFATWIFEGSTPPYGTRLTTDYNQITDGTVATTRKSLSIASTNIPYNKVTFQVPHNSYEYKPSSGSGIIKLLDQGYRAIEIDIYNRTNTGDDYVRHNLTAIGGNSNHCGTGNTTLSGCLQDVRNWLDKNENSAWKGPITVWIDTKGGPAAWTDGAHNATSITIKNTLGSRVLTPAELKAYVNNTSLRRGVADVGWPYMQDMTSESSTLGDIIVILTGDTNSLDSYATNYSGSANDQLFLCPRVDDRDDFRRNSNPTGFTSAQAAWVVCGNFRWGDHRQEMMNESYSNNFLSHVWEGAGGYADLENFHHVYIANSHGAQFLSRDNNTGGQTFRDQVPLVSVRRSTPGYFSLQSTYGEGCLDISGDGTHDGAKAITWTCGGSEKKNQNFVYTMEGQLRPRHATKKCIDIKAGGRIVNNQTVHIWDCDGGKSEKWEMQSWQTSFKAYQDNLYALISGGRSKDVTTRSVAWTAERGIWKLIARSDWPDNVSW